MADKGELFDRLPMEHLARLMNNQAGVREMSQAPGDFFKARRKVAPAGGVATANPTSTPSVNPLSELIKGV